MANRCFLFLLVVLCTCQFLAAQQKLTGKVYAADSDSVIVAATVYNKNLKVVAWSTREGSYSIFAREGDTLIFSAVGFTTDTLPVQFHMLLTMQDISLERKIILLEKVKVTSSYREDSLKRHNYYQDILKRQAGITGYNAPEKGFGVVLSPLSYLSKAAKQKRVVKKRLLQQDEDDYIDRAFPAEWVQRLTGLQGDSLKLFLYGYRPSYAFCRKTDRTGMLIYINDRLKEFRKPKNNNL